MVELKLGGGSARTAVDVLEDWTEDPRYGFLSEFGRQDRGVAKRLERLARFHVNSVQFYDWMYRHHQLLPPADSFTDALGRRLSLATVRRAIEACHRSGMAALAYSAVYAAEKEFSDSHSDWALLDARGEQHSLADLFFLMDLGGTGWFQHMLDQLRMTIKALDFDGFHLDQYGYPLIGYTSKGRRREVARDMARFVARAASSVRAAKPKGAVIFNCVDAWPLVETSRSAQAASYIEVWKPYSNYADLYGLIARAREVAPRRLVILAAYPTCLREKPRPIAEQVSATIALLVAVVLASGGWPLLVGEGDRILADPYYPNHVAIPGDSERLLREILDLGVAAREFLRDRVMRPVEPAFIDGPSAHLAANEPISSSPVPGHVWVAERMGHGCRTISLVDLVAQTDAGWDRRHSLPKARSIRLTLEPDATGEFWVMSPGQPPMHVIPNKSLRGLSLNIPLRIWTVLLVFERQSRLSLR